MNAGIFTANAGCRMPQIINAFRIPLENGTALRQMPEGQVTFRRIYARQRYRKVTTCARLQVCMTPKVPSPMPMAMLFCAAHATASA